jgi:hypothetical protein
MLHLLCDCDHFAKVLLSDRAQVHVGIVIDQNAGSRRPALRLLEV